MRHEGAVSLQGGDARQLSEVGGPEETPACRLVASPSPVVYMYSTSKTIRSHTHTHTHTKKPSNRLANARTGRAGRWWACPNPGRNLYSAT